MKKTLKQLAIIIVLFLSVIGTVSASSILQWYAGGTGNIKSGYIPFGGGSYSQVSTSTNLYWDNSNSRLGIGSTTPWAQFSINPNGITGPAFSVGSSTLTSFLITNGGLLGVGTTSPFSLFTVDTGSIYVAQNKPATSTSMTLSGLTSNDFVLRMGTAAYTVTLSNMRPGQKMTVDTCNPGSAGGAVTWSGVQWDSGTAPTQITTANKCQTWYFRGTFGTSTPIIVGYPASSGF